MGRGRNDSVFAPSKVFLVLVPALEGILPSPCQGGTPKRIPAVGTDRLLVIRSYEAKATQTVWTFDADASSLLPSMAYARFDGRFSAHTRAQPVAGAGYPSDSLLREAGS